MMTHPLVTTEGSCTDHKDCTTSTYSNDVGVIGVRHLHQWLDNPETSPWVELGHHDPDHHVFGAINVGILYAYDPETGDAHFEPDHQVLTGSIHHSTDDCGDASCPCPFDGPEHRLNDTYPIADDHRQAKDKTGNHPKLVRPGAKRPKR
jgi:hypothetical protein